MKLFMLLAIAATTAAGAVPYRVIAMTGMLLDYVAPGVKLESASLQINRFDDELMVAQLFGTGVTNANNWALIFTPAGSSPQVIAREGDQALGMPLGTTYKWVRDFHLSDAGVVTSLISLDDQSSPSSALYRTDKAGTTLVLSNGMQAPGLDPGVLIDRVGAFNLIGSPFNARGDFVIMAQLASGIEDDWAVFLGQGGGLEPVLHMGDPIAGGPPGAGIDWYFNGDATAEAYLSNSGDLAFLGRYTEHNFDAWVIVASTESGFESIVRSGVPTRDGWTLDTDFIWDFQMNSRRDLIATSFIDHDTVLVHYPKDAAPRLLAREHDRAPGFNDDVRFLGVPGTSKLHTDGSLLFDARITGPGIDSSNRNAIFTADPDGDVTLLLHEGKTDEGIDFVATGRPDTNGDNGLIVFLGRLVTSDLFGYFVYDETKGVRPLVIEGQLIDVNNGDFLAVDHVFEQSAKFIDRNRVLVTIRFTNTQVGYVVFDLGCGPADLAASYGVKDLDDIDAFLDAYINSSEIADLAVPIGSLDVNDIDAFLGSYVQGCP
ncbi:MAG: GC-type dockerin domain-anchored protein [Planctomycetota bacterium]